MKKRFDPFTDFGINDLFERQKKIFALYDQWFNDLYDVFHRKNFEDTWDTGDDEDDDVEDKKDSKCKETKEECKCSCDKKSPEVGTGTSPNDNVEVKLSENDKETYTTNCCDKPIKLDYPEKARSSRLSRFLERHRSTNRLRPLCGRLPLRRVRSDLKERLNYHEILRLIKQYDDSCERVIGLIPKEDATRRVVNTLRAYFVLAVVTNKIYNPRFINLYYDAFSIMTHEYGMPSVKDMVKNDYKVFNSLTRLVNKIHEADSNYLVDTHEELISTGNKFTWKLNADFLGHDVRFEADEKSSVFYIGRKVIMVDEEETIKSMLEHLIRYVIDN